MEIKPLTDEEVAATVAFLGGALASGVADGILGYIIPETVGPGNDVLIWYGTPRASKGLSWHDAIILAANAVMGIAGYLGGKDTRPLMWAGLGGFSFEGAEEVGEVVNEVAWRAAHPAGTKASPSGSRRPPGIVYKL